MKDPPSWVFRYFERICSLFSFSLYSEGVSPVNFLNAELYADLELNLTRQNLKK